MQRYEVVRLIGEGGMGRVYEAIDLRTKRHVAIKTLRANLVDAAAQRLLLNEATAAARVRHPGIVELLDLQRDERGTPYLVMELVDGDDTSSWIGRWPGWGVVAPTLRQIADALAAAHANGIVHGDLKPANIMLTNDGVAKLIDLGIARVLDPMRVRTAGSGVAGTPTYMAPEQFEAGGLVGPWTDLYAFGVFMAELLAGRSPFEATTVTQLILAKHEDIVIGTRAGLDVPSELLEMIAQLLRPEPRRRPRFAATVRDTIARLANKVKDDVVDTGPQTIVKLPSSIALGETLAVPSQPTIQDASSRRPDTGLTPTDDVLVISGGLTGGSTLEAPASTGVLTHGPVPLVGREEEIHILEDMMRQTCAEGGVRAMILCGASGAGKSRIARHGHYLAELRGQMEGLAAAYDPARPGVEALADAFRAVLGTSAVQWAGSAPTSGPLADHLAHWLGSRDRDPMSPEAAAEIAHRTLVEMSAERPTYVWLDDVDAARDGGIELATMLLQRQQARALVVATVRGSKADYEQSLAASIGAHPSSIVIELGALEPAAQRELVRTFAPLAPRVLDELSRIADDTPLLVMHRVRDWQAANLLEESPSGLVPAGGATVASLVADHPLDDVLKRRARTTLDVLGARAGEANRAVVHMALLGMRFEERVLRASVGHDSLVDDVLDVMLLEGLLIAERGGVYRFDHALIRNALLAPLEGRGDAAQVCQDVARALVQICGNGRLDVNVHVATLLRAAGDPAAWVKLTEAAQGYFRAGLFDAGDDAVRMAERWLENDRIPEVHELRADLLMMRAHGAYFQLHYEPARQFANEAIRIWTALPPEDSIAYKIARARFRIASIDFYEDHFSAAESVAHELTKLERPDDTRWMLVASIAHHLLSDVAAIRGDFATAEAEQREAMRLATAMNEPWRWVLVHAAIAELRLAQNDLDGARALIQEVLARRGASNEQVEGEIQDVLIRLDVASGRYAHARTPLRTRLAEVERRRDPWRLTSLLVLEATISAALDTLDDALASTKRFVAAYRAVPHDEGVTWWMMEKLATMLEVRGAGDAATIVRTTLDKRKRTIAERAG